MTENIYSAIAVANWFIDKNTTDPNNLTHLKVQKLLYFAQGFYLANFDIPLFEEDILAWKYGPVVQPVYIALRQYGDKEIKEKIEDYKFINGRFIFGTPIIDDTDEQAQEFLTNFWNLYAKLDPWYLVTLTHNSEGPWQQIHDFIQKDKTYNEVIPKALIKTYFKGLLEQSK